MKKIIVVTSLFCFFMYAFSQGLQFHGNEKNIDGRSSLAIPAKTDDAESVGVYEVGFSMRNHNIKSPGNIFCIHNRFGQGTFALMYSYYEATDEALFVFAKSGERNLFSTTFKGTELSEKTMPVSLKIDRNAGEIHIAIGSHKSSVSLPELMKTDFAPQLHFSMSRHMVESASFSIRDLTVTSDGKKTVIPLTESEGETVHDSEGNDVGRVTQPYWLITRSYYWHPEWTVCSSSPTGFAFDPSRHLFYSYNSDSLKTFDARSRRLTLSRLEGDSLPVRLGMNFFDGSTGRIIPYEVYYGALFAELDPESRRWRLTDKSALNTVWHHHASVHRKKDNTLLLFGGYGNRRYSDKLIRYHLATGVWDTIPLSGDRIEPRFYTSMMMTASEDTIYLYGGKGNPEGLQDLGTKYYYDFYLIDLKRRRVSSLWQQKEPSLDRVPARTLIPDADGRHFYVVTYPEYRPHSSLQLYRVSMADGSSTAVGDTIPLISEEIATNVALYSDPATERLYCVVQQFEKYGQTTTSVYSLATPPVSAAQLLGPAANKRNYSRIAVIFAAPSLLALLVIVVIMRRTKSRRRRPKAVRPSELPVAETPAAAPETPAAAPEEEESSADAEPAAEAFTEDSVRDLPAHPASNYISLFGPFSASDAKGRSVTHLFSPKLKLIFIYILLHTEGRNGVTSADLNVTFWDDKEPDKVKNLRNVTLNKLRKALADIEGISLVYEQGVFRIETVSPCASDIGRLCRLTSRLSDTVPAAESADEINSIVIRGKFLADTPDPVFDYFRQKMDTFIVKYLSAAIPRSYKEGKYDLVRRLCYTMLETDPLSETALTYLIRVARATGRHDRAKAVYKTFCRDYLKMMGEDYPRPFADFG